MEHDRLGALFPFGLLACNPPAGEMAAPGMQARALGCGQALLVLESKMLRHQSVHMHDVTCTSMDGTIADKLSL